MVDYRFLQLMQMLHFADNATRVARGQPGWDPLFKLRPIIERICAAFQVAYTPTSHLTIDEGMSPWRGHLSFKVITSCQTFMCKCIQYSPWQSNPFWTRKPYVQVSGLHCKSNLYYSIIKHCRYTVP